MTINAYAAHEAKAPLQKFHYDEAEKGAFDAEIEISHCGICHSDLHLLDGDWGRMSQYPLVAGHEIIGTVKSVGSAVDDSLIGKRVGIGWQRGSCLSCEWCLSGQDELCADAIETCVGNYGGFAEGVIVDSRFAHVIPDGLESENAAPLLCAGITVFSPLMRYASSTSRVGVIGIGGLGHLALQYANKMGCHVTAFSSTEAKKDEAIELGAHDFVNGGDTDAMKKARRSCDFIIATATANLKWTDYIRALRPNGTLCFVNVPSEPLSFYASQIQDNQQIAGSSIGGRHMMQKMLDFSAGHNITAWTEKLPMDSINTALERLRNNDVRYRFVLEN